MILWVAKSTAAVKGKPVLLIRDNWTHWTDISENWRACIEKIFNEGNHIIIKQGIIEA